jgi:NitT/TauT family transport system substrate-binding protein
MSTIRKAVLARVLALILPLAGVVFPAQQVQARPTVNVGTVVWIGYAPFYVADALDTYKKYGVKVNLVNFADNSTMPGALQGGSIDGAMLTYDMVIGSAAKGWPFKVVLPIDYSNGGDAIVAKSSIKTIKDMKGMHVAYNPLSPSDFLLAYALQSNGMSESDIVPVHMSPESVAGAMASGAVEAGVTYQPSISTIVASGDGKQFHVVLSSRDAPGLITDVLVFKDGYIKKHPKEVKAIMQGYFDALAFMEKEPKKAAKYIAKAMGVTPEEALEQLGDVHNPTLSETMGNFEKSDNILSFYSNGKVIGDILLKKGQIDKMPGIEGTLDDQFVKTLLKK